MLAMLRVACWRRLALAWVLGMQLLSSRSSAGPNYIYMAGVKHTTYITLTTPMGPQTLHPMGDASGGGGGGFINQHMKLLSLLTLAIHMKVDAVTLPPATSRDNFLTNNASWQLEPASSIWDTESIAALLHRHNIQMILGTVAGVPPGALQLPSYFCRVLNIDELLKDIRRHIRIYFGQLAKKPNSLSFFTIYAPDLLLAMRTDTLPLYVEVARAVNFAPVLMHVADGIIDRLLEMSPEGYNGLHLRVEGDMLQAHNTTTQAGLQAYYAIIRELNYTMIPLYVASGIFLEGGRVDVSRYQVVDRWLKINMSGNGHASFVANRRLMMREALRVPVKSMFTRLHSEQGAAIDFLVLMRSRNLIGTRMSSFSFMLREFRALAGFSRNTSRMVDDIWDLFRAGASFAVP